MGHGDTDRRTTRRSHRIIAKQRDHQETIEVRAAPSRPNWVPNILLVRNTRPKAPKVPARSAATMDLMARDVWLKTFAKVNRTRSPLEQRAALMKIRNLDGYPSAEAYLYSRPLTGKLELAYADQFFAAPKKVE